MAAQKDGQKKVNIGPQKRKDSLVAVATHLGMLQVTSSSSSSTAPADASVPRQDDVPILLV